MKKNVGDADSYIRFLFGIAFMLNIIILEPGIIGSIILLTLCIISFYTSFYKFCLLYKPFKICTTGEECNGDEEKI